MSAGILSVVPARLGFSRPRPSKTEAAGCDKLELFDSDSKARLLIINLVDKKVGVDSSNLIVRLKAIGIVSTVNRKMRT